MKRNLSTTLLKNIVSLLLFVVTLASCQEKHYRIAVSQSFNDDWHTQLSNDLMLEASTHPELVFSFKQANSDVEQQIQDVEDFLKEGMDLLIISPADADRLSPVIEKVFDQGIPVILIDCRLRSGKYTASIGVDNVDIGERAGSYAGYLLKGKGTVIEVKGLENASTTIDRHKGFVNAIQNFPDVEIVDSCNCGWNYKEAYSDFDLLLSRHPDVDLVYAANDVMAQAVYDVCVDRQVGHMPYIIGVDALSGPGKGVSNVLDGKLTATCVNPTGGFEAVNLACNILEGRPYERNLSLKTTLVFASNANLMTMMHQQRTALSKKIEDMNGSLNQSWRQIGQQRWLLALFLILCVLLIWAIFSLRRNQRIQAVLRQKVEESTKSKLNFFTNVSHSFRTPLSLIADPINLLVREGGLTKRQEDLLQIMSRNTDQLLSLTEQVMAVLQSDMVQDGEKLDAVAQDAVNRYQKIMEFRNNRLNGQVHPELLNEAVLAPQSGNEEQDEMPTKETRQSLLVIDDNADVRRYIELSFEKDFIVLQADNGQDGLQLAQQNIPDVIICDVMMPVMDGLECCRLLKEGETTSHIPVLMLTAYALDDQRILGYQSGADAYITKPFNVEVLRARIKNLLDSRRRINAFKDPKEELSQVRIGNIDRDLVEHLHDFITKNISNTDLGIPDLCDEFNMSRVQVYRKFKSLTGQSPVEIIRIIRLKRAKQLLETTELSVAEIAYEVGFSSSSYFAKCYRDQYKETPTDVLRRERGTKPV